MQGARVKCVFISVLLILSEQYRKAALTPMVWPLLGQQGREQEGL